MANGTLTVLVSHCDPHRTYLQMTAVSEGGAQTGGGNVDIPYGRSAAIDVPDFFFPGGGSQSVSDAGYDPEELELEGEVTNSQLLAKIEAQRHRIAELEQAQESQLAPTDELTAKKVEKQEEALQESADARNAAESILKVADHIFEDAVNKLKVAELEEVQRTLNLPADGNKYERVESVVNKYKKADTNQKGDLLAQVYNLLEERNGK